MSEPNERWKCDCSGPDAATCTSVDTFYEAGPNGACGCPCHSEYSDDPEHWQPLCLRGKALTDAEIRDADDWLARMDAAKALIEEAE